MAVFWVMRHASARPTGEAKEDDQRPLDKEGVMQSEVAGTALKVIQAEIECCYASPLVRSMQTAEIVCSYLGITPQEDPRLQGSPVEVWELIQDRPYALLVGHAPQVSNIVMAQTGAQVTLAKGGMACIHDGEIRGLLNPSACMVLAGRVKFSDPAQVDQRSVQGELEGVEVRGNPDGRI